MKPLHEWPLLVRRFVAYVTDVVIFTLVFMVVAIPFGSMTNENTSPVTATIVIGVLLLDLLWFWMRDGFSGQGPGKRWMKLEVIHINTKQPAKIWQSMVRTIILSAFGVIEALVVLVTEENRRIGDYAAKTAVITKQ